MKPHLPNVCQHLLARPDLLSDPMYAGQVKAAIEHDEKLAEQWEAASAELLSYATMLAHDMEALGVWKMPESWHMWQKRDHQPDKHWGQPLLAELAALKAQRDELAAALRECITEPDAHCLALMTREPLFRRLDAINQSARAVLAKLQGGGK